MVLLTSLCGGTTKVWAGLNSGSVVELAKKSDIPSIPSVPSIIDNLTSSSTTAALSANQGRVLKSLIDSAGSGYTQTFHEKYILLETSQTVPISNYDMIYFIFRCTYGTQHNPSLSMTVNNSVDSFYLSANSVEISGGDVFINNITNSNSINLSDRRDVYMMIVNQNDFSYGATLSSSYKGYAQWQNDVISITFISNGKPSNIYASYYDDRRTATLEVYGYNS